MNEKCWICCKDLSNITSTVQANLINNIKTWREEWEKKPYKFFTTNCFMRGPIYNTFPKIKQSSRVKEIGC